MEELLGKSLFFLYLLSVVTVSNLSLFNMKQRVSVVFILTYGIGFNQRDNTGNMMMVYISFLCAIFLMEEYWNEDEYKNTLIRKIRFKIIDYIYYILFIYKGFLFSLSYFILMLRDSLLARFGILNTLGGARFLVAVSVLMLIFSIQSMFSNPVEHNKYSGIMKKINEWPLYLMRTEMSECESGLKKRLEMIADVEDKLFFARNAYTVFSLDYIRQYRRINNVSILKKIRIKGLLSRGHSTIEAQLFRTFSYKKGLKIGKPNGVRETCRVFIRKMYETFFTHIFFQGLKQDLLDNGVANLDDFRYYILFLYVHTVITWCNGVRFMPMDRAFEKKEIYKWDIDKLFIATLGLSYKGKLTIERVRMYEEVAMKYGVDIGNVEKMIS